MKQRNLIAGIAAACLSAGAPVHAGPPEETAFAVRAAALQQAGEPTHRRSRLRTWAGLGLVGAGVLLAFTGKKCGTSGSLGPGWMQPYSFGTVSVTAEGLEPVVASGGRCVIEFTVNAREILVDGQRLSESVTIRLSRLSELDFNVFRFADSFPQEERDSFTQDIIGSAAAVESRSRGRMAAGLGMAGAGILLSTVFARTPITVTRLDRSAVAVGTRLGW